MTQSRTHYIPVSWITIDTINDAIADALPSVIDLDILCPAAGYDTTPPNPAIYCPANGYFPSDSWVPPVETLNPDGSGGDQILLLCDDLGGGAISVSFTVNSGNRRFECLTTDMTVIYTQEQAANVFNYIFPTQGTGTNYIIRLSCVNPASSITIFARSAYTNYSTNHRILQAKFYTPNITSIASAFQGYTNFKELIFLTNVNLLSNMSYAFDGSGIESITWPAQMNGLTTFNYTFQNTYNLKHVDISGVPFNMLSSLSNMFRGSNIGSIKLPASLPEATNFSSFAQNAFFLKSCTIPTSMPKVTTISAMFTECKILEGDFIYPSMPLCTSISSSFYNTRVRKIAFTGSMPLCTTANSMAAYCKNIEELVMPTELAATYTDASFLLFTETLKKFTPPTNITFTVNWWGAFGNVLTHFDTCTQWGTNQHQVMAGSRNLTAFIQPTLRVTQLVVGQNTSPSVNAPLTSVDIDFANSSFSATGGLVIRAELPTAEINRIYTALPTVTGKTIAVNTCPGFSGANHAIAQAKGWTVTGA